MSAAAPPIIKMDTTIIIAPEIIIMYIHVNTSHCKAPVRAWLDL